ncbi:hypothetical protein B1U23_05165 (plasmid) [Borreliella burgdorferi]|uniref:Uncharacterized protein n=11 Tax=Borreliella burgdorferi TaxID=139 RepID=Q9R2W7_BORBU|nr:DUF787 family protein [Borreliella burgdorferi]AAF07434.1 conserved hypothetical protein [Borreliella burgdorferi B31]AAF07479.1 conserved hypothetical protein [Borreliella burgdorferi B31]AAF07651.1 conserved hypothetical protein [Borreliella burgdorferi B31]ACN24113.1 conserved hypothetical protein [Borreliella burgdorferi 64b]ACN24143.1 conserved hypothetical protein [Borreliella burgdorferi 64b]
MPQDTISVSLLDSRIQASRPNYYNPLLVYKTAKIKVNKDAASYKILNLTVNNYEKQIETLEKENGNGEDQFGKEKTLLKTAMSNFFNSSEESLKSADLFIYKDKPEELKNYLKVHRHTFVVLINTEGDASDDGLKIYKDDYNKFKKPSTFFVFSTKEQEIKELFKDKGNTEKERNIAVYSNNKDNLHLKFISQYLHQASIFHAVNPYGMPLAATPLVDDTVIGKLRTAKINFYSLLNETGLDGVPAFKEGVDLAGGAIDEQFTYHYIKNEAIIELIRIWNKNNRQNSKLSALQLSGARDNAYTSAIECLLKRFVDRGLIIEYKNLRLTLSPTPQLKLELSVNITYNFSINAVALVITTQDIVDYQNSLSA